MSDSTFTTWICDTCRGIGIINSPDEYLCKCGGTVRRITVDIDRGHEKNQITSAMFGAAKK